LESKGEALGYRLSARPFLLIANSQSPITLFLMLKALELFGFKSFADKTRLEFPPGISVVVGPNGSGKSNIVDAVKWVLGSQSAKSLRGKEMTDVIFNGCASRGPLGTGEVTLTLDNSQGRLAIEAKEVHVTRRVYRSGEGEYLLNRQPCRLRDIRELLAATGITTEAYCIIEQGKVDALLQSSPRDRRVIFEEAAGISQFKIKKAAATRRMERVEQNLLRLSDIVDEVESRLRSVRQQAGKARRYREYIERLKQFRTELALVDFRALTGRLSTCDTQLAGLRSQVEEWNTQLTAHEAAAQEIERTIEASAQKLRELESQGATTREQIAARQATVENQQARRLELEQEIIRAREQLSALNSSGSATDDGLRDAAERLAAAEAELALAHAECNQQIELAELLQLELDDAVAAQQPLRTRLEDCIRSLALLKNQAATLESQLPLATADSERLKAQLIEAARQRDELSTKFAPLEKAEAELVAQADDHRASLRAAERRLVDVRRELSRADAQHRRTDAQLTRVRERIAVLTELEDRLEGLGNGVQDALRIARESSNELAGQLHGVVADLFHVDVDTASLIEVALGERTQFIVFSSANALLDWLSSKPLRVADRVGFLSLDSRQAPTALDHVDLSGEPGVMGRADQYVETAADFRSLACRLLGRTWLVDGLTTALRLSQTSGRGLEFVTSDGEFLAADGTLLIGPRQAATGMLSRRSELRACHEQARDLENQLAEQATVCGQLDKERSEQESLVARSVEAYTLAAANLSEMRRQTASCAARLERVTHDCGRLDAELRRTAELITTIQTQIASNRQEHAKQKSVFDQMESELQAAEQQASLLQERLLQAHATATEQQIALARCEQRAELQRQQLQQAQRSQAERDQMLADTRQQLEARKLQMVQLDDTIVAGKKALADLVEIKQSQATQFEKQRGSDEILRKERAVVVEKLRFGREQVAALQSQQHQLEVGATRIRHEVQTLCDRMQEDYGIDLAAASRCEERGVRSEDAGQAISNVLPSPSPPHLDRDAAEREIIKLRDQIQGIGAINLDALNELEEIESRFEKLSAQHRDLVEAKNSLDRIVQRINIDSRQLFLTTLETIRGHFQELFRRLFGGGEADIIVDESEDVLEGGIEIVAKPPGKEACSISLLSGGEKTLTCVALLLAVFHSKPSPFCILDEVDAALDEANIGRFVSVLREFLSFTQFIVITHSKKTMAGADTIYGVTMEESGVSKRVSVRFEDVSEDGHISQSALRRAA
jgi:chromosome segregation protein